MPKGDPAMTGGDSPIELVPARTSDVERLVAIHASSFPDARGFPERRANFMDNPRGAIGDLFAARAPSGELVGHGFLFRMKTWIAGGEVQVGGVASIGVAPEARGRRVGAAIVRGLLEESRRRGDALQLLHPFAHRFYAALGFGATSPMVRLRVPTAALPHRDEAARTRRASAHDLARISAGYALAARAGSGLLARSEALFAKKLAAPGVTTFVVAGDHADAPVRGHVSLSFDASGHGDDELCVRELVARDDEARRALIGVLAAHRDQAPTVELTLAGDDPLPLLVAEPRASHAAYVWQHLHPLGRLVAGPMARAVEVSALLRARGWLEAGRVDLRVVDGDEREAPAIGLTVRDGGVELGPAVDEPLVVDVATFTSIALGSLRPSDAARHGRLRSTPRRLAELDRLFATGAPFFCLDEF